MIVNVTEIPPDAPANVSATAVNDSQVDLDWDDVPGVGITYSVYRDTTPVFALDESTLLVSGLTESAFSDTSASASTTYYYTVLAVGFSGVFSAGTSANGGSSTIVPDPRPGVVSGLHMQDVDTDEVTITWKAAERAMSYSIYRVAAGEEESETPYRTGITDTSFTDENLPPDGTYRYAVSAVNDGGEGPNSSDISTTPQGPAAGALDPLFGSDGVVTDHTTSDASNDVVVQPDGKVVVFALKVDGLSGGLDHAAVLTRYNPDGSLDSTFGNAGTATTGWRVRNTGEFKVKLQADGKLVLIGSDASGADSWIARCNVDGSRDLTFASAGRASFSVSNRFDYAWDLVIQPDGRIVVVGGNVASTPPPSETGENEMVVLARYLPNGQLDSTFGSAGKVTASYPTSYGNIYAVALQDDGNIVLAGSCRPTGSATDDMFLMRFNAGGSVDSSFGTGGHVVKNVDGGADAASDIIVDSNGRLLICGKASLKQGTSNTYAVYTTVLAYLPSGSPDTSFGTAGMFTSRIGISSSGYAIALQRNEKIVLSGISYETNWQWASWRLLANGDLDTQYGSQGHVVLNNTSNVEYARGVVVAPDGGILVTGAAVFPGAEGFNTVTARFTGDGLNLIVNGLAEERTKEWTNGEPQSPHETGPGAFIPLNDDFDEADPEATDPQSDLATDGATADDDELVHASLVFTGSHDHSGWMLDYPADKLRVYEQRRNASTGELTLHEIEPNDPQAPPEKAVVNLRIEGLETGSDFELNAFLLPPDAVDQGSSQASAMASSEVPQDSLHLGVHPALIAVDANRDGSVTLNTNGG